MGSGYRSIARATPRRHPCSDGIASNGDELYLQKLLWNGTTLDNTTQPKQTIPADAPHLLGDQNLLALSAVTDPPKGAILAAWEDLNANVAGQSPHVDVLVSLIVTPIGL